MVGLSRTLRAIAPAVMLLSLGAPALAQELVYTPVNPSFGGDSFNSAHLLGIANAQNKYRDPNAPVQSNSQMDQFLRQLQSRLLSSLAAQVNDAIFGDNPQESGTITFGDQIITFVRGLDSVRLTIQDLSTGTTTEVIIPLLGAASPDASSLGSLLYPEMSSSSSSSSLFSDDGLSSPPPLSDLGASRNELGDITLGGL